MPVEQEPLEGLIECSCGADVWGRCIVTCGARKVRVIPDIRTLGVGLNRRVAHVVQQSERLVAIARVGCRTCGDTASERLVEVWRANQVR